VTNPGFDYARFNVPYLQKWDRMMGAVIKKWDSYRHMITDHTNSDREPLDRVSDWMDFTSYSGMAVAPPWLQQVAGSYGVASTHARDSGIYRIYYSPAKRRKCVEGRRSPEVGGRSELRR
jgi:hypothetical protein